MHHVSIRTGDLARAIRFYGALGFLPEASFTGKNQQPAAWLAGPHGRIELFQVASDRGPLDSVADPDYVGYDHLALAVDSLKDVLATLRKAGARVLIESAPWTMNGRNYQIAAVRDPDGLLLELVEEGPQAPH